MATKKSNVTAGHKAWIEPNVTALTLSETALTPNRGVDGETRWVDCTS